jgi:polyisoprenoid-binding protein YceI
MKLNRTFAAAGALAAALLITLNTAAETITYRASPGSKIKIEGTSTVHDWTVETGIVGGWIEMDSNFPIDPAKPNDELKVTPNVAVNVPVRSLKSGKKLMDEIMHDAMKVEQHQTIRYKLTEMKAQARKAGDPLKFDATGELEVAGVKKPISFVVTMEPVSGNKLKSTGAVDLKMTDFGIKPPAPSVGLGLIKTGDEIKLTFEWLTAKTAPDTAAK